MKRLISLVLAILMLGSICAFAEVEEPKYTRRKSMKDEAWLWDELSQHSPNDYTTAAVLSYFWRESQYRSDAVAGYGSTLAGYGIDLCDKITTKTDKGLADGSSRDYFIKKARWHGGYGLGQWYALHYVEDLYDFAQLYGTSIGDARMQCAFVFYSLEQDEWLWKKLCKCESTEEAGYFVAVLYDGSKNASEYVQYKAKKLYEKYHAEEDAS